MNNQPITLKEAVEKYKLDKRRRWFSFCGNVVYNLKFKRVDEEGNKFIDGVPIPAINPETGNPIEITDENFVYYRPKNIKP